VPQRLAQTLAAVVRLLELQGDPYMLVGALAVVMRGWWWINSGKMRILCSVNFT
jgi:hypothetical protein